MPLVLTNTSASLTLQNNTSEQTVFTITNTQNNLVKGIWLDLVNLTQNATIRAQYQIDGTNYRTFQRITWTTGMDDGVFLEGELPFDDDFRVTIQSSVLEGAIRTIPYEYMIEGLGIATTAYTYTLTSSTDGSTVQQAEIFVSTDSAGALVVATGTTNSSGQVTFRLSPGTYYFFRTHALFSFTNPDVEIVP